ncbi:MAG: hypothetical protein HY716_13595 [Planctomycetes bacterium]|nr:hypothetical protein [Planctomycetota bacterium]
MAEFILRMAGRPLLVLRTAAIPKDYGSKPEQGLRARQTMLDLENAIRARGPYDKP